MKKKKIAFVVAIPGTAESFLTNHLEVLTKKYEVSLIANFPDNYYNAHFSEMNIRYINAPIVRKINIIKDFTALFKLLKIFKIENYDSIHSITPKAGLLCSFASWMAGIKVRIHIYTGQVWATRSGMMRYILKMMDKTISLLDTHILVDGEGQRQFLIKEGVIRAKNSQVLAHGSICGVKLENFCISEQTRMNERKKFGFKNDDVVFVFLGRLNHDKGIGEIYEAFNRLVAECSKAKLLFYGSDEEEFDKKVSNYPNIKRGWNFFYPGLTKTPYNSLQGGDVFVLPTWREGFGMSVIEAQALGLPVITSDAYGVCDASVPNETGLRCKVNDPESLYTCMKVYYQHPEMRKRHGMAGRKRVEKYFDHNIVTNAWTEFYNNLFTTK